MEQIESASQRYELYRRRLFESRERVKTAKKATSQGKFHRRSDKSSAAQGSDSRKEERKSEIANRECLDLRAGLCPSGKRLARDLWSSEMRESAGLPRHEA